MENSKVKKGVKSSEFWVSCIGAIVPVINETFSLELDPNTIMSIIALCITYVGGRSHVKASEVKGTNG
jgi:hypothetical protein